MIEVIPFEKRNACLEFFERGIGYTVAARELNLKKFTVRDWGRRYRQGDTTWLYPHHGVQFFRSTPEMRANAVKMHEEGKSLMDIARYYGVPKEVVVKWLRKRQVIA